MKRRALLPAALVLAMPAWAQGVRPRQLAVGEELRGRFTQERQLQGFARPLRSQGDFLLLPGQGLIWRNQIPFASTLVISPHGLLQIQDGQDAMRLPAARAPGISRFYDVLAGALAGEAARLEQAFAVTWQADAAQWQLHLVPRQADDPALAQIASIAVTGSRLVETVRVNRQNGDADLLTFSGQVVGPAAPSADELAQLRRLLP